MWIMVYPAKHMDLETWLVEKGRRIDRTCRSSLSSLRANRTFVDLLFPPYAKIRGQDPDEANRGCRRSMNHDADGSSNKETYPIYFLLEQLANRGLANPSFPPFQRGND